MRYYCDICLRDIKKKSKYSHLKSKSHKEFEKYKHILLSVKNVDIKDVDEILYLYIKDKKFNHYLLKGQFKLVLNNNQDCKYIVGDLIDNRTNISWSNRLRDIINILKEERYHFNYRAEMNIISLVHKRDMTFDFYLKHNMSAVEWKLNAMINKDKSLINKFPQDWRHPINTRFYCYWNNII